MKKRLSALLLACALLVTLLPSAQAEEVTEEVAEEVIEEVTEEEAEEEDVVYDVPITTNRIPFLPDQGPGWRWSGQPGNTLTLENGLRLHTSGTCVTAQADVRAIVVEGAVSLTSANGSGIDLGGAVLSLASGASLTIKAAENGITGEALSLSQCTLSITAGGVGLSSEKNITLGEGVDAQLGGDGIALQAGGSVNLSGTISLTSKGGGIAAGGGFTLAEDASLSLSCESPDAAGLTAGRDAILGSALTLISGGSGITVTGKGGLTATAPLSITAAGPALDAAGSVTLRADAALTAPGDDALRCGGDLTLKEAALTIAEAGGHGVSAGGSLTLEGAALTIAEAGGHGVSAGGNLTLEGATLTIAEAGDHGVSAGGDLTVDAASALTVTKAGSSGVSTAGLLTVDGPLRIEDAGGDGLVSTGAGLLLSSDVSILAKGDGIRCLLGVTTADTSLLTVEAGKEGVVSETSTVTVAVRAGETGKITSGGNGVRAGAGVSLCQPGYLELKAGAMGIKAQGDVNVGGVEGVRCDLLIESAAHSIWSDAGHVSLKSCDDCYFFRSPIRVDTLAGKTISILEGAALIYGIGGDAYLSVIRKDYTITPDKTPTLMVLRTLQIGADHTVTVASGAKIKMGPLILGKKSFLVVEDGATTYYDGPVTQVLGNISPIAAAPQSPTDGEDKPDNTVVSNQENPDGSTTKTSTDAVTGVVTKTTTAPDGALTVEQTRPDGVASTLTVTPEGDALCDITLPQGAEPTVVSLPVPGMGPGSAVTQVLPDGSEVPVPFSDYKDGAISVLVDESGQLRLSGGGASDEDDPFSDVPADAWYAESVDFVTARGLFLGLSDGDFGPDETMTCSMSIAVLHRLAGAPPVEGADEEPYYAQALAWGREVGIVVDDATGDFGPDALLTRQQLAVLLHRAAPALGLDAGASAPLTDFTDVGEAGDWALEGLGWAVSTQVLWGRGAGILDPSGTATRAEVATMLRRYINLFLSP